MKYCIFDIESDGLINNVTKIYCLSYCILDENLNELSSGTIIDNKEMKNFINSQEYVVGHNIIRYDLPVIEKLLNNNKRTSNIIDTLGLSWYLYSTERNSKNQIIPKRSHSLETWGKILDTEKVEIKDWKNLSIKEYVIRCEQDVRINKKLFVLQMNYLMKLYDNDKNQINRIINYINFKLFCAREQEENPLIIDKISCEENLHKILSEIELKKSELSVYMPKVPCYTTYKKPKNLLKSDGNYTSLGEKWLSLTSHLSEKERERISEIKVIKNYNIGNPSSVAQIKDWLFSLGWKPTIYKESKSKVTGEVKDIAQISNDGEICKDIERLIKDYPYLENLKGLSILNHRKGVFEGFLESINNRNEVIAQIDGFTNSMRFQHRKPIANMPKVGTPYGKEIRGLITVSDKDKYCLCGSDMTALEDTTKQHYMYFFDPEYVKQMRVPGFDPHIDIGVLAKMITEDEAKFFKDFKKGLIEKTLENTELYHKIEAKRFLAKTTNFASVYGAGPPKIAKTTGMSLEEAKLLHKIYWERNKAVKSVASSIKIKEVNGQMWCFNPVSRFWYSLRVEKDVFSVINQSTGVYLFDSFIRKIREEGLIIRLQYHDEILLYLEIIEKNKVEDILYKSIKEINNEIKLNVPLGISLSFGEDYSQVH